MYSIFKVKITRLKYSSPLPNFLVSIPHLWIQLLMITFIKNPITEDNRILSI